MGYHADGNGILNQSRNIQNGLLYHTLLLWLIQVGVKSIETGVWGAYQNVLINLKDVKDDDVRQKVRLINIMLY